MARIKLVNTTEWSSVDLRALFRCVLEQNSKTEGKPKNSLVVTVKYGRRRGYSGVAWRRSGYMTLRVPRGVPIEPHRLAFLFEHELQHCRGYGHDRMGALNNWDNCKAERYPGLIGFSVGAQAPKPARPRPDLQIVRFERIVKALAEKERIALRISKQIRKLRVRHRYYEKALAAAGKSPTTKPREC